MATAGPIFMANISASRFTPIIREDEYRVDSMANEKFDPKKHLSFSPPESVLTMKDLGFKEDVGVSPIAVSRPFRLFTNEAVMKMRSEILNANVMQNYRYGSNIGALYLRGYAARCAPFTHNCWYNEATLSVVSEVAGVDLVPEMDFEIGHINISVKSEEQTKAEREITQKEKSVSVKDQNIMQAPWEDDAPVVGWHTDSYPFVCVVMLSDCSEMIGGETALRTASGDVLKVRGPEMGCAVVMQGRYIAHQALRALGTAERITMVTSFRPRSPFLRDDTTLTNVRPISNLSELYYDFGEYRLEIMEQRIQAQLEEVRHRRKIGKKFPTDAFKNFLREQTDFFTHTNGEIVQEDKVPTGYLEEMLLPEVKTI